MKPILFNTDMVRAILDNRKTVTRRVAFPGKDLNEFPREEYPDGWWFRGRAYRTWDDAMRNPQGVMSFCKYHPGDILYVRETFSEELGKYVYKADGAKLHDGMCWHPSIHMPREAARIFLRVTDVRAERLQDITEEQAVKEGFEAYHLDSGYYEPATLGFVEMWDATIKPKDRALYGWDANPWVWVIEFERLSLEANETVEAAP